MAFTKLSNMCQFIGNLGKDPEMRYTPQGTAVATFSLAVNEGSGDKQHTEWLRITAWGKDAEYVNEKLSKGARVIVQTKYSTRKSTDSSGSERVFTDFTLTSIEILSRPNGGAGASAHDDEEEPEYSAPF